MSEYNFSFDWARVTTLGKVKILVEQVVGAPSQAQIDAAVAQYIEDHPGAISGLSEAAKTAILQLAEKVVYIDEHGEDYYDAIYDAFYPPVELTGITAVYTQSGTVYNDDSLDSLKADLVVTAFYTDGTSEVVPAADYTLSGILSIGTATITVTYEGQTATFNVTVTERSQTYLYNWDFTQSLIDSVSSKEVTLGSHNTFTPPTRTSEGVVFTQPTQRIGFGELPLQGKTIEIDVAHFEFKGNSSYHVRFLMNPSSDEANPVGLGSVIFRSDYGWTSYGYKDSNSAHTSTTYRIWNSTGWGSLYAVDKVNAFDNTTVKVVYGSDGHTRSLYVNGTLIGTMTNIYFNHGSTYLSIGGITSYSTSAGDQCYDMTVSGVRIYDNE